MAGALVLDTPTGGFVPLSLSLSRWPIRMLLPGLVLVVTAGSLLAGVAVGSTERSVSSARTSLSVREAAKSDIDTFAFLNERGKYEAQVMQSFPTTLATLGPRLKADQAEMSARIRHLGTLPLGASERAAVDAVQKAQ